MDSFLQYLPAHQILVIEQDNARTHRVNVVPSETDDENDYNPSRYVRRSLSQEERVAEKEQARWECTTDQLLSDRDRLREASRLVRNSQPSSRRRRQDGESRSALPMTCPKRQASIDAVPDKVNAMRPSQPSKAVGLMSSSPSASALLSRTTFVY